MPAIPDKHEKERKDPKTKDIHPAYNRGGQGVILMDNERLRIRTLTPRECWRLMGFPDDAYDKASKVCTKTELYRQAGNSIVVDVLVAIFDSLYNGKHPTVRHLEDY